VGVVAGVSGDERSGADVVTADGTVTAEGVPIGDERSEEDIATGDRSVDDDVVPAGDECPVRGTVADDGTVAASWIGGLLVSVARSAPVALHPAASTATAAATATTRLRQGVTGHRGATTPAFACSSYR